MHKTDLGTLANQSILVTGGAGFIGSHLSSKVAKATNLIVLDDFSVGDPSAVPDEATVINKDITDRSAILNSIPDVDIIFHQAGLVSVSQSVQSPYESHTTNATGTVNVLDTAREHDARIVLASSAAIYGHPEYTPIDEHHPFNPTSPYGVDKLTADYYTRLYADLYDLESIALRYFNVFGPGQTGGDYAGVIPIFIEQALSGADITVHGDGQQTRDFVYVDDVVQANLLAAQTDAGGVGYNIATGKSTSIQTLAEMIRDITDSSSDIVHTEGRSGDIEHSVADISGAKSNLNYQSSVSLYEGLERTIDWYQNNCFK